MNGGRSQPIRIIAGTAVVMALVAGVTLVDRGHAGRAVTVSATGEPEALPPEPGPSTAPAQVTSTTAITTTTTTAAPRPSSTTSTTTANAPPRARQTASGSLEPRVPGGVRMPYRAGQTVWSATSNGVAMTLRTETPNPVAGAPLRVTLEATPPPGATCCYFQLVRDDGVSFSTQTSKSDSAGCVTPTTTTQRVETTVGFNRSGRVEFAFQATTMCATPAVYGVLYGFVDVGAGRSASQGPSLPVLRVDSAGLPGQEADHLLRGASAFARDEDGYIAGFTVDWGDGSAAESFPGDPLGCMQLPAGWPNASQRVMSAMPSGPPPTHRYTRPATYTVTVTTWSTGCDGGEVQRVSASFQLFLG